MRYQDKCKVSVVLSLIYMTITGIAPRGVLSSTFIPARRSRFYQSGRAVLPIVVLFALSASAAGGEGTGAEINSHTEPLTANEKIVDELLAADRPQGGLGVVIGAAAEHLEFAEKLLESGPWVLHHLEPDSSVAERARERLLEKELYGRITVEHWEQSRLPYADNLVNFIVLPGNELGIERAELARVLAPQGRALMISGKGIEHLKAPRPDEMGEWTHPWHDAGGSLSVSDRAFGFPNAFQWVAGPPFTHGHRKGSTGAILSAGGRVFQITSNVRENLPGAGSGGTFLVARDAFNGTLLWSREWEGPTTRHTRGADEAIVAGSDRLYGARNGAIDVYEASTGEVISTWSTEGEAAEKLLLVNNLLIAQSPAGLTVFDIDSGKKLGHREIKAPWGAIVGDGNVYCLSSSREEDGRWKHELIAVNLDSGQTAWTQPVESEAGHAETTGIRLHFAGEQIVCLIEGKELRFLSAEDGSELWRYKTEASARGGHDPRMAGHFLFDEKVWIRDHENSGKYVVHDPRTGRELRTVSRGSRRAALRRCQPMTATSKFAIDGARRKILNFETGARRRYRFFRGGCEVGVVVANGMGYIPPNSCGCYSEQYRANAALIRSKDPGIESIQPGEVTRGPAYGETAPSEGGEEFESWPFYRRDGRRSAHLPRHVPAGLTEQWRTTLEPEGGETDAAWQLNYGRPLSPPSAADGMVFLAVARTHQVVALDMNTGEEVWRFAAAGRVSSPPAIHGGLALFGAHDGYIYALRVSDGVLVWRRRAAPSERRIMAYGRVESAWPVRNVLVHDGMALAAAGRAVDAGGGAVVHAFQPDTGELHWSSRIPTNASYGKPDLLVMDGEDVYLMNQRLDMRTGETTGVRFGTEPVERVWNEAITRRLSYPEGVRYLRSGQAGFFETAWTRLQVALRKHISSWSWGESEGEIIAFSEDIGYSFQIDTEENMHYRARTRGGGRIEARGKGDKKPLWLHEISGNAQVQAMFVSENALFVAGPAHRGRPLEGGFLRVIDREDGSELAELDLPAGPVHDGMAAAGDRVFVVLEDGSVLGLRGE